LYSLLPLAGEAGACRADTFMNERILKEITAVYGRIRPHIEKRLSEFREVWERGCEEVLFEELVFCLLTPGARARNAWACLEHVKRRGLLLQGDTADISQCLKPVRFKNNKARNIVEARQLFCGDGSLSMKQFLQDADDDFERRELLVSKIRGMGYKEASHFLRNIGLGRDLAILDRHVLRNLHRLGLIPTVFQSLTKKRYLETERAFQGLAARIGIPASHLDFVFWYQETGDLFK
jgi:N-glycosylase/DNA lyase